MAENNNGKTLIILLIVSYITLGVIYILSTGQTIKDPDGRLDYGLLLKDLFLGGFNLLKMWFKF